MDALSRHGLQYGPGNAHEFYLLGAVGDGNGPASWLKTSKGNPTDPLAHKIIPEATYNGIKERIIALEASES